MGKQRLEIFMSTMPPSSDEAKKNGRTSRTPHPYGKSLGPAVWRRDTAPASVKALYVVSTASALIGLTCLPSTGVRTGLLEGRWDDAHDVDSVRELLSHPDALGLPRRTVTTLATAVATAYAALAAADVALGTFSYPRSWRCDDPAACCYDEMFAEPTRPNRLVRRPGNAISNATYLFDSACVLASILVGRGSPNPFRIADAQFAVLLFALAASSTAWHGCNAPASHYVDLWSMDCCIAYLIVRYACVGLLYVLQEAKVAVVDAQSAAATVCAAVFAALVVAQGRFYLRARSIGWLDGRCPLSVRARLEGRSNVYLKGHVEVTVGVICAFLALPVAYLLFPSVILLAVMGGNIGGSIAACETASRTLVVAWSYRLWERFLLDGNRMMIPSRGVGRARLSSTIWNAIFSPTAVLHVLTGITLLSGYAHVRSIDGCLLSDE